MIRLNLTQRALLVAGSAVGALANPLRGDLVATLGETTGVAALNTMRDKMRMNKTGMICALSTKRLLLNHHHIFNFLS